MTHKQPLTDHLKTQVKKRVAPDADAGYFATMIALKANEAVLTRSRIDFRPDWFALA